MKTVFKSRQCGTSHRLETMIAEREAKGERVIRVSNNPMKTVLFKINSVKPDNSPYYEKTRGKVDPETMGYLVADRKTGSLKEKIVYLHMEMAQSRHGMVISRKWWERKHNTRIVTTK